MGSKRATGAASSLAQHAAALALSALFVMPLCWVFTASLRQPGLPPPAGVEWLPNPPAWENYASIFALLPFGRYTLNSTLVAAIAVPLTLATASWAGFALAQFGARTRERLLLLSFGALMVPGVALWLTRFVLFTWLGLVNTFAALVAPAVMGTSPLFVLLFFWAFRRLPREWYESARLDGASALGIWWRIALPQARSTVVAVAVLAFLHYWSDFVNPLLFIKSESLYTLPVGLSQLLQLDKTNWSLLMAGVMLLILPPVALFLLVERHFLEEGRLPGMGGR